MRYTQPASPTTRSSNQRRRVITLTLMLSSLLMLLFTWGLTAQSVSAETSAQALADGAPAVGGTALQIAFEGGGGNDVMLFLPLPTLVVDTEVDEMDGSCADGDCAIRDAVALVNAGGTITFDPLVVTIVLTDHLTLTRDVTIDGGNTVTLDGNGTNRHFTISNANATLQNMTLQNGNAGSSRSGGSVEVASDAVVTIRNSELLSNTVDGISGRGAAIYSSGSLTLLNSVVAYNVVPDENNAAVYNDGGTLDVSNSSITENLTGGIINNKSLMASVTNSTISNNERASSGGGIANFGSEMTVLNSTISGNVNRSNSADFGGGGIYNATLVDAPPMFANPATLTVTHSAITITNSTIVSNTSGLGGAINNRGGEVIVNNSTLSGNDDNGIYNKETYVFQYTHFLSFSPPTSVILTATIPITLTLNNSIVTGHSTADCISDVAAGNDNLASDSTCGSATQSANISLAALADNGCVTQHATLNGPACVQTMALQTGSAAIDNVNSNVATATTSDQREIAIDGTRRDIGAFEESPFTCFATPDDGTTVFGSANADAVQAAINAASAGGTVKIAGTCVGTQTVGGSEQQGYITKTLTLIGGYDGTDWSISDPDTYTTTLDADFSGRGLTIRAADAVMVQNLTIINGDTMQGAGIHVMTTTVGISNTTLMSHTALDGGGLYVISATVGVTSSTFISNVVDNDGGAVYSLGTLRVVDSRFENNSAEDDGGAVHLQGASTIDDSTFVANSAEFDGGAIYNEDDSTLTISNTHLISNTSLNFGGGLYSEGSFIVASSHFTANQAFDAGAINNEEGSGQLIDSTLFNNQAANGGGIYNFEGSLSIQNTQIISNVSFFDAGAILNESGLLTVTTSTIAQNDTQGLGGGIYNIFSGTVSLDNTDVYSNGALIGGGITSDEVGTTLAINGGNIHHNKANFFGGGVAITGSSATISGTNIYSNVVTAGSGGGIINNTALLTVTNALISNNVAQAGGGVAAIDSGFGGGCCPAPPRSGGSVWQRSGSGHGAAVVQGRGLSAAAAVTPTVAVSLFDGVTIEGNSADSGGGIHNADAARLTLINSTLRDNSADGGSLNGGGIYNGGTAAGESADAQLRVDGSTFSGNSAENGINAGGGIGNFGVMTVTNSTFSGNAVDNSGFSGGGLYNVLIATVTNSTFSGNSDANTSLTTGGGIMNESVMTLTNSIVANSLIGNDCANVGGTLNASDNLIEDGSCGATITGDPLLGPLADNGGATLTHIIMPGSPANDAGNNATCAAVDQRGVARPRGPACDIGAVEVFSCTEQPYVVTSTATLNLAIGCYNAAALANTYTISFTSDITLTTASTTIDNALDGIALLIAGNDFALDGNNAQQGLKIEPDSDVTIENLTIRNGNATAANGGAILSSGTLTLSSSALISNTTAFDGGAISNNNGRLTVINSTLANNSASVKGGAIHTFIGVVTISDSSLRDNVANTTDANAGGGAVFSDAAAVTVSDTIFSGNAASRSGGAILSNFSTLTIDDSVVEGNSAEFGGGGLYLIDGTITISNSQIISNTSQRGGGAGIHNQAGTVTINASAVSTNTVVTNGQAGGGIENRSGTVAIYDSQVNNNRAPNSGGIYSSGTNAQLLIQRTTIAFNRAAVGGIVNWGSAEIGDSTIANNDGDYVGGINNLGNMHLTNSTVSGNNNALYASPTPPPQSAPAPFATPAPPERAADSDTRGGGPTVGGIHNSGNLTITHGSIISNTSIDNGCCADEFIGGLYSGFASATISNTLFANNTGTHPTDTTADNCFVRSGSFAAGSDNIADDDSCSGFTEVADGLVGPLQNNGGSTDTHALLPDSPAIDAASSCMLTTDQRGSIRPLDGNGDNMPICDVGAYEGSTVGPITYTISGGATITEPDAGTVSMTFTVTRSIAPNTGSVAVTLGGTATAGDDYIDASATLTFPIGTLTQTVTVVISGDLTVEPNETIVATLSNVVNGVLGTSDATITIIDNDDDGGFSSNQTVVRSEGNSGDVTAFEFEVTRSSFNSGEELSYSVSPDTADPNFAAEADDFVGGSFPSGDLDFGGNLTTTLVISVAGDLTVEPPDRFIVTLAQRTRGLTITNATAIGSIQNDDIPTGTVADVTVDESVGAAVLTMTLDMPFEDGYTGVYYSTISNTATAPQDYEVRSFKTFTFGNGGITQTVAITVPIVDDTLVEGNEMFTVTVVTSNFFFDASRRGGFNDFDVATVTIIDNDEATVALSGGTSVIEGDAGSDQTVTLTATLDVDVPGGFSVVTAVVDGTATVADGDFAGGNGTLTFAGTAGEMQTFTVTVNGDNDVEPTETFSVTLGAISGTLSNSVNTVGSPQVVTIANDDVDLTPDVVNDDQNEGDSGTTAFTFVVTRTGDVSGANSADFTVSASGTNPAEASDFGGSFPSGSISFAANQVTQTVTISVTGDTTLETDETFAVTLDNPARSIEISPSVLTGTIRNDDRATLSIDDLTVAEDVGTASVTVTLSAETEVDIPLLYTSSSGTAFQNVDFIDVFAPITITAGTTQTFATVIITDDLTVEASETFRVDAGFANTDYFNVTRGGFIGGVRSTITILDNDTAAVTLSGGTSVVEGDSGSQTLTFTATLDAVVADGFSVAYATVDDSATAGSDYDSASGALTFTGALSETQTFTVAVNGDTDVEADETFSVTLGTITSTVSNSISTMGSPQVVIIVNDDTDLTPDVVNDDQNEGDAGTTAFTFVVTRTGDVSGANSADFTVSGSGTSPADAEDFGGSFPTGSVNFAAGETTQTVTISVTGDTTVERRETFAVTFDNPARSIEISPSVLIGTIRNDDSATVSVDDLSVDEAVGSAILTVTLSAETQGITAFFTYATSNGSAEASSDYVAQSGSFSMTAGITQTTITVPITDDLMVEVSETVNLFVTLEALASGQRGSEIDTDSAEITIVDNDSAAVTLTGGPAQGESDSGATASFIFTATLNTAVQGGFSLPFTTDDDTATVADADYVDNDGTLTFTGAAGETQLITVTVTGDDVVEVDETFTVTLGTTSVLSTIISSDAVATGTILNDDAAALSISDLEVDEGVGTAMVTVTQSAESAFTMTVDYFSDNREAQAGDDYIASSGTITFTPGMTQTFISVLIIDDALDENGEGFNLTLTNPSDASIADGAGIVTIIDNEDAPTIMASDQTVSEADGSVTVTFTLSAVSSLDVGFDYATADGTALQPSDYISQTGRLTITAGMTQTIVTLTIVDDNIAENGEQFVVDLSNPSNAQTRAGLQPVYLRTSQIAVTITDDDVAGVTVAPSSLTITETESATFTIRLDTLPTAVVTITLQSDDPGACSIAPTQVVIQPADFATPQVVTVTALFDADSLNETCMITDSSIVSDDGQYDGLTVRANAVQVDVTVLDRETTAVGLGAVSATSSSSAHGEIATLASIALLLFALLPTTLWLRQRTKLREL